MRRVLKSGHGRHLQAFGVVRRLTAANGLPRRLIEVQVHAKVRLLSDTTGCRENGGRRLRGVLQILREKLLLQILMMGVLVVMLLQEGIIWGRCLQLLT